ncbi:MAG TPA: stimulus-sensing domain-containing protein [Caulobacteraceae bacterium]|nr:stimulus-sensing domain-containing protein [Caulobacteraceae bacterium]
MALDTATARPDPARPAWLPWRFAGSRLGRLILALNLLGLLILIGGAFLVTEIRRSLIETRLESLTAQGELLADIIADVATEGAPVPAIEPYPASLLLREGYIPNGQRARLFNADGALIADSYLVSESIEVSELPPARKTPPPPPTEREKAKEARKLQLAREALQREVTEALRTGEPVAGVRRSETGRRIVSVSIPVQRVRAVLGVMTLEAGDVDAIVAKQRWALLPFVLVALGVNLLSSLLLHLLVARPIMRLSAAADQVRLSRARAISMPDLDDREDEIGDLARSLETMTETLSDRMDAIERFAADVSHEIKNPLTSVRSAVETLELVKDEAPRARLINLLKQDVRRLDRLITDISNASRLDAELSRDAPRSVDLGRLVGEIVSLYGQGPRAGDVPVRVIAESQGPLTVSGREGPLGQVFRNLIDNARSFSPPGGEVRVFLGRTDEPDPRVIVRVEDDGPGIPDENLESVFERFYTSRPKGAAFGGNSGLGLSIARQIVDAHGGDIRAENRLDAEGSRLGARFVVRLRAAQP